MTATPEPATGSNPNPGKEQGPKARVALGALSLPAGARRIVLDFRRKLESALGPELTLMQAIRIRSACVLLAEGKRAQLRLAGKDLTDETAAAWSDRLVRHSAALERALIALGLGDDTNPASPWDAIHGGNSPTALQPAPLPSATPTSRPGSHPGDESPANAKSEAPKAAPGHDPFDAHVFTEPEHG